VVSGSGLGSGFGGEEREVPAIAVTLGDPAGIGPEIVVKALTSADCPTCRPLVCGSPIELREAVARLAIDVEVAIREVPPEATAPAGVLYCHPSGITQSAPVVPGHCSAEAGRQAIAAIETATALCRGGQAAALVTAPISKAAIHLAGSPFPGHTEMLAALTGAGEVAMLLLGGPLRVVLVTIHEPLARVASLISVQRITSVVHLAHRWLVDAGVARPTLAVAGLNPHAGEGGEIGREEVEIIAPAVTALRAEGIDVAGPLPADTLFHAAYHGAYDAVVAMYHDQGLAPVKMIAFDEGVNVTLGLPFPRTSPDHGTAFAIAGRGVARPDSLLAALRLAVASIRS
jgi:4-hydroxythreonine-4-phosphate dehydrogenase